MEKLNHVLKKMLIITALVMGGLFSGLVLVEFLYRWQVFDFYRTELNALNPDIDKKTNSTLLVFGDSFSATQDSWVKTLRDSLPEARVINSAVPGTGVFQAAAMARKRFNRFQPDVVIYQVYAGNDLFDVRYPVSGNVSFGKKFYWFWANRFRSLGWMNYMAGRWKAKPMETKSMDASVDGPYNEREVAMLRAEPKLIRNQVMLENGREDDFKYWLKKMEYLLSFCEAGKCEAYIVFIPHAAQVNENAFEKMKSLGAEMGKGFDDIPVDYPFCSQTQIQLSENQKVQVLNPVEYFRNHPEKEKLYYKNDPHLTPFGQQVLGEWILQQLK